MAFIQVVPQPKSCLGANIEWSHKHLTCESIVPRPKSKCMSKNAVQNFLQTKRTEFGASAFHGKHLFRQASNAELHFDASRNPRPLIEASSDKPNSFPPEDLLSFFASLGESLKNAGVRTCLATLGVIASCALSVGPHDVANALPSGNAISSADALLRLALPIDNKPIRETQASLEAISNAIRVPGNGKWGSITRNVRKANNVFTNQEDKILAGIQQDRRAKGKEIYDKAKEELDTLQAATDAKDAEQVATLQKIVLRKIGDIEQLMVEKFPFEVPSEYSNLPQLLGRAVVEFEVEATKSIGGEDVKVPEKMIAVIDGYSAPVTAGNFIDLVQRGFYNGLPVSRSDGFVVQTGDPSGPAEGFMDPKSGEERHVPLEILVKGDKVPEYGETLEEAGRFKEEPVLPFSAYGTIAMARPEFDNFGASSQFFWLLFEAELTPAGMNLLDGRYTVFGYVTEGADTLRDLKVGDKVISVKVLSGLENLKEPSFV